MMPSSREENPMLVGQTNRRALIAALGSAAAWPIVARAQQGTRNSLPVSGCVLGVPALTLRTCRTINLLPPQVH
jgi:hypothetical protein